MLTLSETDCKSFLRLYQNRQLQKRKRGGTGISFPPLYPPLAQILPQNRFPVNPWFTMNHGVQADLYVRYRHLQKLCVSYMPSLSGTQMFNAKFANIVVWQREPLCAAVSRFGRRYKDIAPPVGSETKFDGFVRDILHPKHRLQIWLYSLNSRVNHGVENMQVKGAVSPSRFTPPRNAGRVGLGLGSDLEDRSQNWCHISSIFADNTHNKYRL